MRRSIATTALLVLVAGACTGPGPGAGASPTPTPTADIRKAKLDIAYTAFLQHDVHKVTSKTALTAALEAVKAEVKSAGGNSDIATPAFEEQAEPILADFRKFAEAAGTLAARANVDPTRLSDQVVAAMIKTSPDCHTYFIDSRRAVHNSATKNRQGTRTPPVPDGRVIVGQPDEAGLQARMLDGNIAWIRFTEFRVTGTYDIRTHVQRVLDQALGQGARAWLFDLRANIGGNGGDFMASWFLNGEPAMRIELKNGSAGVSGANKDLRLPAEYQLPIAIVMNDVGGSAPEVFTLFLKENKRATVVGMKTIGCLGATTLNQLPDGSHLYVTVQEFVGAQTGAKYNNAGIPPDIAADDASAVAKAVAHLKTLIK